MNPLLKLKCLKMLKASKLDFIPKAVIIQPTGAVWVCNMIPKHSEIPKGWISTGGIGWRASRIGDIGSIIGGEESFKSIIIL